MSAGHSAGHIDPANKKVALLIAVLTMVLALSSCSGGGGGGGGGGQSGPPFIFAEIDSFPTFVILQF